jgi:hypothetical protein
MTNIYLFCLVLGFTFTVAGALLGGLLGGHHGDSGGDLHAGGHSVGGHEIGAGHHVLGGSYDAGHGGHGGVGDGHAVDHSSSVHLPILSPAVLSCIVASFGGSGLIYEYYLGDRPWLHAPLAGVTSLGLGVATAFFVWKVTSLLSSNRVARTSDALSASVEVTVSVPIEGAGEIAYVSAGTRQTLTARSADGREHKQGSSVRVLRVDEGIAWVSDTSQMMPISSSTSEGEPSHGEPVRDREHTRDSE